MNFSLVLMILTVLTGVIWALDRFVWRPQRLKKAKEESDKFAELNRQAIDQGEISVIGEARSVYDRIAGQPLTDGSDFSVLHQKIRPIGFAVNRVVDEAVLNDLFHGNLSSFNDLSLSKKAKI